MPYTAKQRRYFHAQAAKGKPGMAALAKEADALTKAGKEKPPMAAKKSGSKPMTAAQRKAVPTSDFAIPSKAGSPKAKAQSGNYPIQDKSHARNALARSSGKPEAAQVKAAVNKKYPGLAKKGTSKKQGGK